MARRVVRTADTRAAFVVKRTKQGVSVAKGTVEAARTFSSGAAAPFSVKIRLHEARPSHSLAERRRGLISNISFDATLTTPAVVNSPRNSGGTRGPDARLTARTIPESTIAALRSLFVRMMREESDAGRQETARAGGEVRDALRDLCDDARANGVRVEQLVIAIKQGWSTLHGERARTRAVGPDALRNQVITLCIDEYYSRQTSK
jgi:hypothetical protein